MYSFFICHSWACGFTSASTKRRISPRMASSVSSTPLSPKWPVPSACWISSTSRARASGLFAPMSATTAGTREGIGVPGGHTEVGKPHRLRLAHRNAAQDLRRVFAHADLREQRFHLAEATSRGQALARRPPSA